MAVYTYFTGLEGNDNGPVGNNQGFKKNTLLYTISVLLALKQRAAL
jgi:hypothetical protein